MTAIRYLVHVALVAVLRVVGIRMSFVVHWKPIIGQHSLGVVNEKAK